MRNYTPKNQMIIETITVTAFQQHTRVVGCEQTKRAICIDPGDDSDAIVEAIDKHGFELQAIACTHAHMDHSGNVAYFVEETAARLGIGERESRPFRGHVTVGRSKQGVDARGALAPFETRAFGAASVDEALVFESRLGGDGSTYVLRHRAALASN